MSRGAEIAARLEALRDRVDAAARRAGRDPDEVGIVAVTKLQPPEVIDAAIDAGVFDIGENYVQELARKREAVARAGEVRWHFVGQLQRNKAKFVAGRVRLVHAVDSARLARALANRAAGEGAVQPVLVAVNLGGEAQKSGVEPQGLSTLLAEIDACEGIRCDGLMTMPPLGESAEESRPYFRRLRALREEHARPDRPLPQLSMGTTADFEVAVEEGASWIRVGTALTGPRPYAQDRET